MAGMFYSLEETAEKIGITIDEVKKLVEDRKLREFHQDGRFFYKVEEVESLSAETGMIEAPEAAPAEDVDILLDPQEPAAEALDDEDLDLLLGSKEEIPAAEPVDEGTDLSLEPIEPEASTDTDGDTDLTLESAGDTDSIEPLAVNAGDEELADLTGELSLLEDTAEKAEAHRLDDTEMSLGLEGSTGLTDGLTNGDTALTQEGLNVLDESDSEFSLTDDTSAETKAMEEAASLEEIEGDVNLDSFGSGSGLLDLSLQADDTSLGGILDEIYTPEGDAGLADASAADVAAAADNLMVDDVMAAPAPVIQGYIEPEPDASSNIFGIVLFVPILVVIYGLIVTISGQFGMKPSILPEGMIAIYGLVGAGVLGIILAIWGWMSAAPPGAKTAKPKKKKAPKVKKVKKVKEKKKK